MSIGNDARVNESRPVKDEFGFAYLDSKDRRLVASLEEEHQGMIARAQATLLGGPVDVERLADDAGVKVYYQEMPSGIYGSLRGYGGGMYEIRVRASDVEPRRRFTLAHELAHYFLHAQNWRKGDIDLQEDIFLRSDKTSQRQEWQANALAAHILMPIDKVRQLMKEDPRTTVEAAAAIFGVSQVAMEIRLGLPIH